MGTTWVEDPSWGNIFSNFTKQMNAAPGEALSNIAQVEAIKTAREKRARESQAWDAAQTLVGKVDAATPQAYVPPRTYTADDISDPATLNAPLATTGTSTDMTFTDPRALAAAQARRELAVAGQKATLLKDPSLWAPQNAYGSVASRGPATTADERARDQFMTTGKYPTAEEAKIPAAHNLAVIGADGQPTGRSILTQDFKRDIAGQPFNLKPGETVLATGPASTTPNNPFGTGSDAVALQSLDKIRRDSAARGHMTEEEAQLAGKLFDVAYPPSRVTETEGGRLVEKQIRAKPIPPSMMPMFQLTQDYARGAHLQPQPPPVQPLTPDEPAPIVPPQAAVNPNATVVTGRGPANPAELRKEISNTQQFSDWNTTVPLFNSAIKSAQNPNNQEDINIIYAFAKLMDPGSVVRESEQKLVSTSGTVPQSILGQYNKLVTGGGSMDPQVRLQIIDTLKNRLDEYRSSKDMIENYYRTKVAPAVGLNPDEVIPPTMAPINYNRDEIIRIMNQRAQQPQQPQQPQTSTNPRVDEILNR